MTPREALRAKIRNHTVVVCRLRRALEHGEMSQKSFNAARQRSEDKLIDEITTNSESKQ